MGTERSVPFRSKLLIKRESKTSKTKGSIQAVPLASPRFSPIVAAVNSASLTQLTGIAPGELITLFGYDLTGPAQVGEDNAALLYAGSNQINLQVPFESTSTNIEASGVTVAGLPLANVSNFQPGLFTTDGTHAAAINQDGTVNSASNPAAAGSVISIYGTGAIWPAGLADGAMATATLPLNQDSNNFQVFSDGTPLSILYEGAAPGLIYGAFELSVQLTDYQNPGITLQVPSGLPAGPPVLSNPVNIYVK